MIMRRIRKSTTFLLIMILSVLTSVTVSAQTNHYTGDDRDGGAIVIENPVQGETYEVYKLFDAVAFKDGTIAYTGTIPLELEKYFQKTEETTDISIEREMTEALKTWTESEEPFISEEANGDRILTFTDLPYGYYVVATASGAGAVVVTQQTPRVAMERKNAHKPADDTKNIITAVNGNELDADVRNTSAQIGDMVSCQVTFTAMNYNLNNEQVGKYKIVDTVKDLAIAQNTIKVKVTNTTDNSETILYQDNNQTNSQENPVTVTLDEEGRLTIEIPWIKTESDITSTIYSSQSVVTLTYDAVLTGTEGEDTATVEVFCGTEKEEHTDPIGPVTVQTASVSVVCAEKDETSENNMGQSIADVKFALYAGQSGETQIKVTKATDGIYVVDPNGTDTLVTDSDGKIIIKGLRSETDYWIEEIHIPDGYVLQTERIKISTDADITMTQETTILHIKAPDIPETGGMGTTSFYIIGGILVCISGILLTGRRNMYLK